MSTTTRTKQINDLIEKYRIAPISANSQPPYQHSPKDVVAFVTGTTGSLGSYVLSFLLDSPAVSKIYAFNRIGKSTLKSRQAQAFVDKGLNPLQLEDDRLRLLVGDLELDNFGLDPQLYEEIRHSVTLVIHLAWPVNFVQSVHRFESNISASCHLIKFSLSSPNSHFIRFLFASSISTSVRWGQERAVPEEVLKDPRHTLGFGYAEAKYVVDRVLEETPLNSSSLRIGQLCGSKRNGAWPIEEWMPLVVKTSLTLGVFPSQPGCVSWLAVDMVARCTVDIALSSCQERYPSMFNITSPLPVQCDAIVEILGPALLSEGVTADPIKVVPSDVWLEQLVDYAESVGSSRATLTAPSIKLIKPMQMLYVASEFAVQSSTPEVYSRREFALFGPFETKNAKKWSESFRETKTLNAKDARDWVRYWKDRKFIKPTLVAHSARL